MELKCISLWYNCAFISIIQRIGSSLIYNTSARNERHEYDTGPTRARHEWRECNTNVIGALHEHTSEKISILITTRLKRYFHIPIFFVWQVKDYKGEEQFHSKYYLWKCLIPMPKCVWKVHHENWTLQW